jgi:hypothetical protein
LALAKAAKPDAHAGGGSGKEDIALAPGQHQSRGFTAGEKAGVTRHLPHLAKNPFSSFDNWKVDIGANVEHANFQRRVGVGVGKEFDHLILLPCVQRSAKYLAAGRFDLLDQRRELFSLTAADKDSEAFGREFLGDLAADEVSGADDRNRCIAFFQPSSPKMNRLI